MPTPLEAALAAGAQQGLKDAIAENGPTEATASTSSAEAAAVHKVEAGSGHKKVIALRALSIPNLPRFRAAADGAADAKHIYFIRHGEATHNIAPRPWGEELVDARLTPEGQRQSLEMLRPAAAALPLELIVTSPLSRTLETAHIGLAPHLERGVKCVAVEQCREQFGLNLPDRRRATAALRVEYPQVDFSGLAEEDELFTPEREALEDMSMRADAFLELLMQRPEAHIAVSTHSSFLAALFNVALDVSAAPECGEWFANAEMRLVRLVRR